MSTQTTEIGSDNSQTPPLIDRKGFNLPSRGLKFPEFHDRLRDVLADPHAKVYIDTSLLMWLLKISATARREFLDWCTDAKRRERIFVTTWCAQELYRHFRDQSVLRQIKDRVDLQKKALDDVVRFADQAYDDSLCTNTDFANKAAAVEGLRNSVGTVNKNLEQFLQRSMRPAYSAAEAEIREFVNSHTVWTDATNIVAEVKPEFAHRIEGKIPPGYDDQGKGENSFGDFIFWREVLAHAGSSPVVILTNDGKTDWIHSVTEIENYQGKPLARRPNSGLEAQVPHPFLTFEANQQGILQLEVINIGILALFLEMEGPSTSRQLAAAAYPRGITEGPFPSWNALGIPRPPEIPVTDLSSITLHSLKAVSASPQLVETLHLLKGEREEIEKVVPSEIFPKLLPTLSRIEAAKLGKAFVRAIVRFPGSQSFADVLHAAGSTHASSQAALYVGMLLGIYLSNSNEVRRTPDGNVAQAVFAFTSETYAPLALAQTETILQAEDVWLLARPKQAVASTVVSFGFQNDIDTLQSLTSVAVDSNEVFDQSAEDQRTFTKFFPTGQCTADDLLRLIATEFAIPFSALSTDFTADKPVTWEAGAGLGTLRTDLRKVATHFDTLLEDPKHE